MFNVACKDPFEAEKVGERRARKARETNEAVDSINDALSRISLSGQTSEPPGIFSSVSSRSSRASSVIGSVSIKYDNMSHMHSSGLHDTASQKSQPFCHRKRGKERTRRGSLTNSETNPFASHDHGAMKHASTEETWTHPMMPNAKQLTPSSSSTSSTSPRHAHTAVTQYAQVRVSTPAAEGPDPFVRFQRLLRRIERTSHRISVARLAEQWPDDEEGDSMAHEFEFETTLYAIVHAQRLAFPEGTNGPAFPVPRGLDRGDVNRLAAANILHLGSVTGSPEAWYLSTKYSTSIIHSLGVDQLQFDLPSSSWGQPPNLQLEEWTNFPRLDYVDRIFDVVIVAHHLFERIKCTLWPLLIQEISRVLVPDAILVVSTIDAVPQRCGPMLSSWTQQTVMVNLLRRFMVPEPSLLLPSWLEEDGHFTPELVDRLQFPCGAALGLSPVPIHAASEAMDPVIRRRRKSYSSQLPGVRLAQVIEEPEPVKVTSQNPQDLAVSLTGWKFYERIYARFLPREREHSHLQDGFSGSSLTRGWWTQDESILRECQKTQPCFEMAMFVYRRNHS
ncbi:hypothetical protein AYL99_07986 [Fonsecaea erecta]|uniref:Uncharacterized protein n=1 Tax=Fonsecaea erecta TaxID=1367422 RepID=A0A178ZBW0_9EURO|nr:hypothetical protein AYL99_07986 [Fonsecaea erecta]OAP57248.1 hypothetical protein AYL99_07986 [Fonsecaea erecta]